MHLVAAPDKFRGTATAREVADAMCAAADEAGWTSTAVPVADGGEGLLDALGGPNRTTTVTGPLGDAVEAPWRLSRGTAVIEMSRASGLDSVGGADQNDPIAAATHGTGELIARAVESGASRIIVGLGGSATTDGGLGALRAMYPLQRLRGVEIVVACDVTTTFVDAAEVFAPQKGASPAQVELLRRRLERLADVYEEEHGIDVRTIPGSGAAGGLGGALAAIGGTLASGFEIVADELALYDEIEKADFVLTGEGFLDEQSLQGKVVGGVAELAAAAGVEAVAVVGQVLDQLVVPIGVRSLVEEFGEERAHLDTVGCVGLVTARLLADRSR